MADAEEIIPLKSRDVFIIGGITNVPKQDFGEYVDFFGAVSMLLQFRYGLNPSFALRDNESKLVEIPPDKICWECYRQDIQSTVHSSFCIADLTYPSTGTGQEIQAAYDNGVPVIALVRDGGKAGALPDLTYYGLKSSGEMVEHKVHRGFGGISKMVDGNPTIVGRIQYSDRSAALRDLDAAIQRNFGLQPITVRLQRAIEIEREKDNPQEVERLTKMRDMADRLLVFDPEGNDILAYRQVFKGSRRLPLSDLEKGLKEPTYVEVMPTKERRPMQKN